MTGLVEAVARAVALADAKDGARKLLLTNASYMAHAEAIARAVIPVVREHCAKVAEEAASVEQWVQSGDGSVTKMPRKVDIAAAIRGEG